MNNGQDLWFDGCYKGLEVWFDGWFHLYYKGQMYGLMYVIVDQMDGDRCDNGGYLY